ncbi:AMP-binding protein [Paraburkholderia graminis]|uniref:AMP-binding protein n=1 Tax=Paraburkholderia graminis TaxID=60548 RepID=UPI0038BC9C78
MDQRLEPVWTPAEHDVTTAQVTSLAKTLGHKDFDALYAWSIAHPDAYWEGAMRWLGIRWREPYASYVDLSEGKAFPRWFPGGKINWVETIFAPCTNDARSERVAVVAEDEGGRVIARTFAQLHEDVRAFAAGLLAARLGAGDRIGLLMENSLEAVVSFLAISWIGAVAVPLFSGFGADAVIARLSGCEAKGLICTAGYARRGKPVRMRETIEVCVATLASLSVVIVKPTRSVPYEPIAGALDWYDVIAAGRADALVDPLHVDANTPFMIIYTSGTTGKPKGTVHTHGGFPLKIAHDAAVYFNLGPGDTWLWPADMGWVAGPITIAGAFLRGATLVCYGGAPDWPDWSRLPQLIRRHGVSHFGASPTLIRSLAAHESSISPEDLASVRLVITAGEVIDTDSFCWYRHTFDCPVINFTGGSEASGGLLANVVVKPIVPGGFNAVAPSIRVDVRGADGQPVRGELGELAVLEPFVGMTRAFWNDAERYLDTYWHSVPGIWIHGDLAIQHEDHAFFLCGRSDDTLKIAGKRVGPAEIEDVVVNIHAVAEAAAVGVADPHKGQRLVLFFVRDVMCTDAQSDADLGEQITRIVTRKLGRAFAPSEVHAVDALPKTRSGKVMRRLIKRAYEQQPLGDTASLENPAAVEAIRAVSDVRSNRLNGEAAQ